MGQTQSIPEPTAGPVKRKKRQEPVRNSTKKKTDDLFPLPDQWDDNAQFKVVSPASDISNPSQFRGRQYYLNNGNATSNTTSKNHLNMPTSSVRRSRTSKVCPKQAPPKHTHLIQPANFYFGQEDNGSEPSDEIDDSHDTTEQIAPVSRPKRGVVELWKAKCARAKQQFMECFQQPPEKSLKQRHFSQRANFQRVHSKDTTALEGQEQLEVANPESSDAYLQLSNMGDFKPVWKEQKYESDPILQSHAEEAYIKRSSLASSDSPPSHDPSSPSKLLIPDEPDTALQAPDKFPSISESEQCDESYSPVEGRALSLHSGSLHRQSIRSSTTKSSSSSSETGSTTIIQERPPVFRSTYSVDNQGEEFGNVVISKRAQLCLNPSSENVLSSDQLHIQDAIQRQIDSTAQRTAVGIECPQPSIEETKGLSRVQRLRMQYQQEIERKANKGRHVQVQGERSRVQSAQLPVTTSNASSFASKPMTSKDDTNAKTLVGNIVIEKNGNSVTGYQQQKADINYMKTRSGSVPGRISTSYAYIRSTNMVTKAPRTSISNASFNSRRSISAPRDRPSLDGPALLHLAGWNQPWKSGDKKIPALLQVAGWNEKTKNFTKRYSLPAKTVNLTDPSEQSHLKSRKSLPTRNLQSVNTSENLYVEKSKYASSNESNVLSEIKHTQNACKIQTMPLKGLPVNSQNEKISRPQIYQPLPTNSLNHEKEQGKGSVLSTCSEVNENANNVQVDDTTRKAAIPRDQFQLRQSAINPRGRPLALMLQQAYFQTDDESAKPVAVGSPRTSSSLALIEASPAPSVETTNSASTIPMLSEQVLSNAGFLFSEPSVLRVAKLIQDGLSITTLDSRNRISAFSGKPVEIPARKLEALIVKEHDNNGSYRRVRFSEEAHAVIPPKNISTFPIETKLSDVTESTTDRRESQSTNSTSMSIPRIDSIPEEEEEKGCECGNTSSLSRDCKKPSSENLKHEEKLSNISSEKDEAIYEDSNHDNSPEKTPAVMRWSYRAENGLMKGVTPLLGGKTTNHTTNSPYLRFKEAKNRFSSITVASKSSVSQAKKIPPVKRSSPVKRNSGSLVTARIAAMEGKSNTGSPETIKQLQLCKKKVRRATTGQDVLAPRHSKLISPYFNKLHHIQQIDSVSCLERKNEDLEIPHAPSVFSRDEDVNNISSSNDSESIVDDEDPFGVILHPTAIDEESCQTSVDCDDFDALLNQESDDDTLESSLQPSVATVLQHKPQLFRGARRISQASAYTNVSSQRGRFSSDNVSAFSSTSSMGDTASVPTVLQRRSSLFSADENSLPSSVGGRIKTGTLPFRDAAPVKPNEQVHRTLPGSSCLSSMQKTPLEARTWRALAAAAQGKDKHLIHTATNGRSRRSSLSERDPNTLFR